MPPMSTRGASVGLLARVVGAIGLAALAAFFMAGTAPLKGTVKAESEAALPAAWSRFAGSLADPRERPSQPAVAALADRFAAESDLLPVRAVQTTPEPAVQPSNQPIEPRLRALDRDEVATLYRRSEELIGQKISRAHGCWSPVRRRPAMRARRWRWARPTTPQPGKLGVRGSRPTPRRRAPYARAAEFGSVEGRGGSSRSLSQALTPLQRVATAHTAAPPARGHAIDARRAPRLAAREARERHPPAGPQAVAIERFVGVFRAGRQMAAMKADERRERVAIGFDQAAAGEAREVKDVHSAAVILVAAPDGKPVSTFPGAAPRLASIWLIASTTASKVSMVEAWRAVVAPPEHRCHSRFSRGRRSQSIFTRSQAAQLAGLRADHVARHDRRGGLPERTGLHQGEIRNRVAVHLQVDRRSSRTVSSARSRGVRLFQPTDPGIIPVVPESGDCRRHSAYGRPITVANRGTH